MMRLLKVAMPPAAETVTVWLPEENVPLSRVRVTLEVSVATVLPKMSCTATVTAGLIAKPAGVFVGCSQMPDSPPPRR